MTPPREHLLVFAEKLAVDPERLRATWSRAELVPFSSEEQCMRVRCVDDGDSRVAVKGAVERVLQLCDRQLCSRRRDHGP